MNSSAENHFSKSKKTAIVTLTVLIFLFTGCQHQPPIIPDPGSSSTGGGGNGGGGTDTIPVDTTPTVFCSPDTVYFEQQILPLLNSHCASTGCHNATSHAHGVSLYDYTHIHPYVSPGHASNSELIQAINDNMPPGNRPQLTSAQLALITTWINQGALNNSCTGNCDTTNATFSAVIVPIFQTACYGCHSGSNPSGNFNMTTWASCNAAASNGTMAGDLLNQAGHHLMPPAPSAISQCDKDRILYWIHHGAANN